MCSVFTEFGIPMKVDRLTKICLNETYGKFWIGKHLSDTFTIYNGLNQDDTLSPLQFSFVLNEANQLLLFTSVVNLLKKVHKCSVQKGLGLIS